MEEEVFGLKANQKQKNIYQTRNKISFLLKVTAGFSVVVAQVCTSVSRRMFFASSS